MLYFDFRVSLLDIKPEIWRRFLLPETSTFEDLNEAIQDSFGWDGEHLFEFKDKGGRDTIACADFDDDLAGEGVPRVGDLKLAPFFSRRGKRCRYIYDLGDNWEHMVEFVGVVELPDRFERRLLDGARACPPEDCGGGWGYEQCVEAAGMSEEEIEKSEDEDLLDRTEWIGDWNPEAFDLPAAKKAFDEK